MNPAGVLFDLYGTLLIAAEPDAAWDAWGPAGIRPVHLCRTESPDPAIGEDVGRIASLTDLLVLLDGTEHP